MESSKRVTTYMGTRQPYAYVVPGAFTLLGEEAEEALRFARLGNALMVLLLLGIASAFTLSSPDAAWQLSGLLLAFPPMLAFTAATVSGSPLEIASGVGLLSALLALSRNESLSPKAWAALGLCAIGLAIARPASLAFLAVYGITFVVLNGLGKTARIVRLAGKPLLLVGSLVALAGTANLAWQLMFQPHQSVSQEGFWTRLPSGVSDIPLAIRESVGVFGWTDTVLPPWLYAPWLVAVVGLVALAFIRSTRRERMALSFYCVSSMVVIALISAAFARLLGAATQGRWVMALTLGIPILAGEITGRHRPTSRTRPVVFSSTAAVVGLTHFLAFYVNARRHAVGIDGPLLFIQSSQWQPPGGWLVWLLMSVCGAAGLSVLGFVVGERRITDTTLAHAN